MITGVNKHVTFPYGAVLYGIFLQYGMANSIEDCRMMSLYQHYEAMYFHLR